MQRQSQNSKTRVNQASRRRRFQSDTPPALALEALEPRTLMSAAPLVKAGVLDPDDTLHEAIGLSTITTSKSTGGVIDSPTDVDMISFDVAAGQRVSIDLASDPNNPLGSVLRLFDARGRQVAITTGDANDPAHFGATFVKGGRYFLGISGQGNSNYSSVRGTGDTDGQTGGYTLTISDTTPADTAGGTPAAARDLGPLTDPLALDEYVGFVDNVDFYKFTITTTGDVTAALSGLKGDANLAIIQDANGNGRLDKGEILAASTNRGNADESATTTLTPGTYFVRVNRAGRDTNYHLSLSFTAQQINNGGGGNGSSWFNQNLHSTDLANLANQLDGDGSLSRGDMIALLREAGTNDGVVDALELADLKLIDTNAALFGMTDAVRVLTSKVVFGNTANAKFQGQNLGNLAAGDSSAKMEELVDKWFLGTDHPVARDPYNSTTYGYQMASGSLFVNGPNLTDIAQGYLGDCYLLASFGATARVNPGAISSMFTDNGDGTFTVRFFNPSGAADYVTVDKMLPADSGQFIFANMGGAISNPNNELWVALAEKAYAQLNEEGWLGHGASNSYQALAGGWMEPVIEEITNQNAVSVLNPAANSIIAALAAGKIITAGTKGTTTNGVISGHAYVLTGYDAATQTFTFYNPWGVQHPAPLTFAQVQANFDWWAWTA